MTLFLRQFHIISSLKSSPDKELLPFYKTIAPVLSLHPAVCKLHTQTVRKNMQLSVNDNSGEKKEKPLAIILSWMMAKESHIDKFRSLYLTRGFDVLTVNMAPKDLLFPVSGSQVTAKNILDYVNENNQYGNIVVHAFSVGGYLMGEMFVKMRELKDKYQSIASKISGVILDSAVDIEGIPTGFPRALSKNPLTIKVLEWYVSSHMSLMYNVATKHYLRSSKNFHNTPLRCPALFFFSEADKVGNPVGNQLVMENWQVRGVDVRAKCWKDSKHVSHMYKYQSEYLNEMDQFLAKINLLPAKV
ncbi:transmembrane protein 53-like [Uloborus diversus]|uniref:transmembrane protein 53-like n=1 Tax=Uloborus diversus TaxID=327109 RepID=UPI002409820D|nr:transmembrane protein 53-like [Uloborus diversus]